MSTVRWNLAVSPQLDRDVRTHLAAKGGRKGDLSKFIEQAVGKYLFEKTVDDIKADVAASGMSEQEIMDMVDEAVTWARTARNA